MFTKRIIPCLDVNNGRVVKGINFINLRDAGDPVEVAAAYDKAGADEVVFLDITASSDNRGTVVDMVRKVAEKVFIPFTVGGGIRTVEDFKALLREGADKISINSSAINTPRLISDAADKFGSQCVVVAIDAAHVSRSQHHRLGLLLVEEALHGSGVQQIQFAVAAPHEVAVTPLFQVVPNGRADKAVVARHENLCIFFQHRNDLPLISRYPFKFRSSPASRNFST